MKKLILLFLALILVLTCFAGCTFSSTKTNDKQDTSQKNTGETQNSSNKDDNKATVPTEKVPEFKIVENDTFAYVDSKGYLILRNMSDGSEETIVDMEGVSSYDFKLKNNKVSYVLHTDKESVEGNVFIMDMKSKASSEIVTGEPAARDVAWSLTGRYLAVDHGTSPTGFLRIYDLTDKRWLELQTPQKKGVSCTDYIWSLWDDTLVLSVPETVSPATPVGEGDSSSIAVLNPVKGLYKQLLRGTSGFGYSILRWADESNVYVMKRYYEDMSKYEYYKLNINDGTIREAGDNEVMPYVNPAKLPEDALNSIYSVSNDGRYVLYNKYDEGSKSWKVILWDVDGLTKKELSTGSDPKWLSY